MSLQDRLLARAARDPARPFLTLLDASGAAKSYAYAELIDLSFSWTERFRARGLKPGARVVIALPHSRDLYTSYLGALLGGFVPAMFAFPSPKLSAAEYLATLDALVGVTGPRAFVTYQELEAAIAPLLSGRGIPTLVASHFETATTRHVHAAAPTEHAFIQYSSGTTGLKKGVAITHAALAWQVDQYAHAISLKDDDVIVSWLPLYHDMGLITAFFLPLLTGTPVVAMSAFDWVKRPAMLLEAIAAHRGTLCWLPNFAYAHLVQATASALTARFDLSSMRAFVNCSEPILHATHTAFVTHFAASGLRPSAIAVSYAMAENTFAVTSALGDDVMLDAVEHRSLERGQAVRVAAGHRDAHILASSGTALPDTMITIVDAAGRRVPDRQVGEVVITSPSLFSGYLAGGGGSTADGFHTGDLGYLAEGQLFVTGRKKDVIIVFGRNIFPEDIERAARVDGVIPGRVVAFGAQDEARGTERAIVIAESASTQRDEIARLNREIREAVARALDVVLDDVRIVPPRWLRKSTSGKMSRHANRQRYFDLLSTAPRQAIAAAAPISTAPEKIRTGELLEFVLGAVRRVVARDAAPDASIGPDDRLITSGRLDSLAVVSLVVAFEEFTGLPIPASALDVDRFDTARSIASMLADLAVNAEDGRLQQMKQTLQMDDRDKACEAFDALGEPVDCLILGSSKAKSLSPDVATSFSLRAFNFWLMSARAEDWYCALRYVLEHGRANLSAVVLAIDVEGFSNAVDVDVRLARSTRLTPYLFAADQRKLASPHRTESDLQVRFDSVLAVFKLGATESWTLRGTPHPFTPRSCAPSGAARAGCVLSDPADRNAQYFLRMAGFSALDPARLAYFDALVRTCVERQIRVISFVSPLHPQLDRFLTEQTTYAARLRELIAHVRSIDHPLVTIDDTRVPAAFDGSDDDFLNAAHIGLHNADLLLHRVLAPHFGAAAADDERHGELTTRR